MEECISHYNLPETPQYKWNNIVSATINAAKETVDYNSKTEIYQNPMIKHLSEKQKELKQQIKSTSCVKTIENLKTKRNLIRTTIHNELLGESQQRIEDTILNLGNDPDDSRKMFAVVKHLQRAKPKSQFLIKNDKGMLTSDQKEQANIIANHFKKLFVKDAQKYPPIPP